MTTGTVLVCGVNWLGDSIMTMPAMQAYARVHPDERIVMLVKPGLVPLWQMHKAQTSVLALDDGVRGSIQTAVRVSSLKPSVAIILPNSFRSAWIPFVANVPVRRGVPGHLRRWLLTDVVEGGVGPAHQSAEYYRLMGVPVPVDGIEVPELVVPAAARQWATGRLEGGYQWVAFLPCASRGPSKQWPEDHFVDAGRALVSGLGCRIVVLGSSMESALCERVVAGIGSGATCLAGGTSIQELAGVLQVCAAVVCNDSGGMHLASAVGTQVVALYGLTDPATTGPMGKGHHILVPGGVRGHRDIPRESHTAAAALRSIEPSRVVEAVQDILVRKKGG